MEIKKVFLETSSIAALKEFYNTTLQLVVETRDSKMKIYVGDTELFFSETGKDNPFYHFAINIPANKIEEARCWLEQRLELIWIADYKSTIADFVNWHAKSIYFVDPAGNILELIARMDLSNETDKPFDSSQFLSVSEMGLVINPEDFNKTVESILEEYKLQYFDKQPPLPQFRAVGDDNGLFIIVPEHRNWYPTSKPAGMFPVSVDFTSAGESFTFKMRGH